MGVVERPTGIKADMLVLLSGFCDGLAPSMWDDMAAAALSEGDPEDLLLMESAQRVLDFGDEDFQNIADELADWLRGES